MTQTERKVALVTGAGQGIGLEIARQLAETGLTVLIGARHAGRGEAAAAKLREQGLDARFLALDVNSEASIASATAAVEREFARLDILVNNAGIIHPEDRQGAPTLAALRSTYETNVFAVYTVSMAFLPLLVKSAAGRIVNVSSGLGSLTLQTKRQFAPGTALFAYNTSKSALNALTIHLAREAKSTPVKINAIAPGHCATAINNFAGPRSPAQGAAVVISLALIGDDGPTGGFFDENGPVPW